MAQVSVIARVEAKPGKGDELVEAVKTMVQATEDEAGTTVYVANRSSKEPDVIWFYELYTDRDAFGAHGQSEAMAAFVSRIGDLVAGGAQIHVLEPLAAKGLALG